VNFPGFLSFRRAMKTAGSIPSAGFRPLAAYPSHIAACASAAVFLGLLEFLVLMVSLAGFRLSAVLAGIATAVSGLGAFLWARFFPRPVSGAAGRGGRLGVAGRAVLLLAGVLYLLLWWLAWTIPDFGWDGLHYHNPTIHSWAVAGRVHWIEAGSSPWKTYIDSFWNGLPKSVELTGFILLSLTSLSRLLNALNLPLVLLGVASLYSLSRDLGAPRSAALPVSALFIAVPVVTAQGATTYIDTGVAAFYMCVFALTVPSLRKLLEGVLPWALLLPLGAAGGLALGAKGPGFAVPVLAAIFSFVAGRKGRVPALRLSAFLALFLLLVVLVGGYWPLRALVRAGSPLYPVGLTIGGVMIFPGGWDYFPPPYASEEAGWSQIRRIWLSWLNIRTDWNRIYSENYGGLGRFWLLGCLPACLAALAATFPRVRNGLPDRLTFLVLVGFCLPLFFFMPYNHNHKVRYTIWLFGMGIPCLAFWAGRIRGAPPGLTRRLGTFWLVLVVGAGLVEGYYTFSRLVVRLDRYLAPGRECPFSFTRVAAAAWRPYRAGFRWKQLDDSPFAQVFAGTGTVALGELTERNELLVGHLTQGKAFGVRRIYFLDPVLTRDPARIEAYIRNKGVRFFIYDAGAPTEPVLADQAILREEAGSLFRILVFQPERDNGP